MKDKELKILLDELFTRNYKTSLYKSLAEYDLFFEKYNHNTKSKLKEYISINLIETKNRPAITTKKKRSKSIYNVGYFKPNEVKKINNELENVIKQVNASAREQFEYDRVVIKELVYVSADYKMKQLETLKTYIDMKNDIVSISQIPFLEAQTKKSDQNRSNPYFYLYCQTGGNDNSYDEIKCIREAIKNYFENIVDSKL